MARICAIDFEYTDGHLAHPTLVCACLRTYQGNQDFGVEKYWLYDGVDSDSLKTRIAELKDGNTIFVAHAVELAEGRCFVNLGVKDTDLNWWDTMLVERLLTNKAKSRKDECGLSLVDTLSRHGLLLEEDSESVKKHKDEMRRIIIEKDNIESHKDDILEYCASDIHLLKQLMYSQFVQLKNACELSDGTVRRIPFGREFALEPLGVGLNISRTAWLFALIDANGIPLQKDEVDRFLKGSSLGRFRMHKKFNLEVAEIFEISTRGRIVKSTMKFDKTQKFIQSVIAEHGIKDWPVSEKTKRYSLKDDVIKDYAQIDSRLEAFRQMRKTDKMLSSFTKEGENNWLSSYDANVGRVFAYHGCCLTQTFRNAHKSKSGFVPAWSKAMRALMMPPKGKALIAVDYSSEEFILGADIYSDADAVDAYKMGDIYLASGIKMGILPQGAKKGDILPNGERVKDIRQKVKGLVLGIGYGMGYKSLAKKIGVDEYESKELLGKYKDLYYATFSKRDELTTDLKYDNLLFQLPNGYMICARGENCDTDKDGNTINATLSSLNWIVQASGAYILQSIVRRCFAEGLKIITTVHDEVIIESDADKAEEDAKKLSRIMVDAYEELTGTRNVRVGEPEIWGEFNGKRCDHNEDGNAAYNELLDLLIASDAKVWLNQDRECYIDNKNNEEEN